MKLNVKDKPEKTDTYGIRLRISLKKRLIQLRAHADAVGMDFPGTIDDLMESVADELEIRIKERVAVNKPLTKSTPEAFTKPALTNGQD